MHSGKRWLIGLVLPGLLYAHAAGALEFREIVEKAKARAEGEYQSPPAVPGFLRNLSYRDYQSIRFNPQASLWREGHSRFQVMTVPPGS